MRSPKRTIRAGAVGACLATLVIAGPVAFASASSGQPKASGARASGSWGAEYHCFGVLPITGANSYEKGCYGHDEPAIDPESSVPGSGQDITWTITLPKSSAKRSLLDLGPTFWVGATVSDQSAVAKRAFSELQFYPDSTLLPQKGHDISTACTGFGFNVTPHPGTWSVCDFTWGLYGTAPANWQETAAYVKVLELSHSQRAFYMHSGDVVRVHVFNSHNAKNEAEQVVTDVTTGQTGSFIMDSNAVTGAGSAANPGRGDGPLTLPYSTNSTNHPMPWGVVRGTPFAFAWEIGHSNIYTHSSQGECVPGQWDCFSYNTSKNGWGAVSPLNIKSVTFAVGKSTVRPSSYGTNDSQGGVSEDILWCGQYRAPGTAMCSFPYYTYNPGAKAILFGTTYAGTPAQDQFGQAPHQYAQVARCNGPLTSLYGFKYFCDATLSPKPPIG